MEQEQQFLTALRAVATARFEGDSLELRAGDGALAVSARKVSQYCSGAKGIAGGYLA